jgi:hypothetical protein
MPANLAELEAALIGADKAGDVQAATMLAGEIQRLRNPPKDDQLRGIALGARGLAQGAMNLPLMAGDALNTGINLGIRGINALGGKLPYLPMATESADALLTKAGAPVAETPQEKMIYQINKGGAAGAAFPPLVAGASVPALQAASGVLASGVQQASENAGGGPVASSLYGALAGAVVPSSPGTLGMGGRGAKAALAPFSEGGREQLVGDALTRMATQPKTALTNIAESVRQPQVSELTTAQAARDPGLLATERGLANLPGSGGRFAIRYAEQNLARRALLEGLSGTPAELEAAKIARKANEGAAYAPVLDTGPLKVTEDLIAISKRPAFDQAAKKAIEIAGNEGLELGDPASTAQGLHYLKMGIDELLSEAKPGTNTFRGLTTMKKDFLQVLEGTAEKPPLIPGYKEAREGFAAASKPIKQMEKLQEAGQRSLNSGLDVQGNRILSQAKWTNAVTDKMPELKKTLTAEQIEVLKRISRDLDAGKLSETGGKVAGSNTFQNLSVANVLGAMLGKEAAESPFAQSMMRPLGFIYKLPERQVEEMMIDAMLDKSIAIRLMSRATQRNIDAVAEGLKRKAGAGLAGAAGSTLAE